MNPRVLILVDVPGWAWASKAQQYVRFLSGEFDLTLAYHTNIPPLDDFDLVHLFEVSQLRVIPEGFKKPVIAGLTAMVWWTWGEEKMRRWADRCAALHGNSRMLVHELQQFHSRVFYTPNGVDPDFWFPSSFRPTFQACHIGKPNPRKGSALIIEAARRANVPLVLCQRTSQIKYPPEKIREFYWQSQVQITASDMDGTPNPMLEAAGCGNALISTPIGNMPDFIVDDVNGILVGRDLVPVPFRPWIKELVECQPSLMLDALELITRREKLIDEIRCALIEMHERPDWTRRLGEQARQTVLDGWTWKQQVQHVAQMWHDVLV